MMLYQAPKKALRKPLAGDLLSFLFLSPAIPLLNLWRTGDE